MTRRASLTDVTPREAEVIALVGFGLRNWEIAERLCIQPSTVEIHLTRIRQKFRALGRDIPAHRCGIVRWAIEQGYAPLTPQAVVF